MRKLRPSIEKMLIAINVILILFMAMINDFEMSALPYLIIAIMAIIANTIILNKWGKLWNKTQY